MRRDVHLDRLGHAVADACARSTRRRRSVALKPISGISTWCRRINSMRSGPAIVRRLSKSGSGTPARRTATGMANSHTRAASRQCGRSRSMSAPSRKNNSRLRVFVVQMCQRVDRIVHAAAVGLIAADRERRIAGNRQFQHLDPLHGWRQLPILACAAARRQAETIPRPIGIAPGSIPPRADARSEPDRSFRQKCRDAREGWGLSIRDRRLAD